MSYRIIQLHTDAPAKPAWAAPCNGCGVCCAAQPCPIGVLVSGRTRGACRALQWSAPQARYRCGLVSAPTAVLPGLPLRWAALVRRLALRWISGGSGCDCDLEPTSQEDDAGALQASADRPSGSQ